MRKIALLLMLLALTVVTGQKLGSAHPAKPAGSLLDVLPDGTAVAVIDFQKIVGSSLWATLNAQEKLKGAIDKAQSEMSELGLKLNDVHTVAVAFPAAGINDPTVAMSGGFEQSDLLARLRSSATVILTSEKYKTFDIYRVRSKTETVPSGKLSGSKPAGAGVKADAKDGTWFVFYDASTLVAGSLEAARASVDVKSGERPSMAQNARFADALLQNPAAAIRFALALTPSMTGGLQTSDLPLQEFSSVELVFGTIDLGAGIELNATLRSDSAEHAKVIAEKLNGLLTMARGFLGSMSDSKMAAISEAVKSVSVTNSDADVKITGNLPMDLLNSLLSVSAKKGQ